MEVAEARWWMTGAWVGMCVVLGVFEWYFEREYRLTAKGVRVKR